MVSDTRYRKKLGTWGETQALEYLQAKGYELLHQNYHTRYGEIDLIMQFTGQLVAVEVKTRRSHAYGIAEYSITRKKYLAIQAAMQIYLDSLPEAVTNWQIDLLVIEKRGSEQPEIIHYENLFLDYLDE